MKKTLLALLGLGLGLSLGINAYSQSSQTQSPQSEVPDTIKKVTAEYLKRSSHCPGEPIIKRVGEKIEDRTGLQGVKDGILDKITLYEIKNECNWINVPNYVVHTQMGLKEGGFAKKGVIDEITSKDKESWKPIPLKEEW